jgi:hypothetical protein
MTRSEGRRADNASDPLSLVGIRVLKKSEIGTAIDKGDEMCPQCKYVSGDFGDTMGLDVSAGERCCQACGWVGVPATVARTGDTRQEMLW